MAWVRIDDKFTQHPKVVRAGPLGMAMQIAALCYCNSLMTDGFVPKQIAKQLLDLEGIGMEMWHNDLVGGGQDAEWSLIVEKLVEVGLWEPVDGGWQIHDYLEYQPSKAEILRLTAVRSEAGRRGGKANPKQNAKQTLEQNGSKGSSKGLSKTPSKTEAKSKPNPTPTQPIEDSAPADADAPRAESKRGSRLPDDWQPSEQAIQWARAEAPDVDRERETARFRDYWRGVSGQRGVKQDWDATWRNWIRRAADDRRGSRSPTGTDPPYQPVAHLYREETESEKRRQDKLFGAMGGS